MNSRERVYAALNGESVDRVPHNFRAWGNVLDLIAENAGLADHEEVRKWACSDFRDLGGLTGFRKPEVKLEPNTDIWGVVRETRTNEAGSYSHIAHAPLQDAAGMDDAVKYTFPDAKALFDFSELTGRVETEWGTGEYFLFMEVESVFDRTVALRGMENFLVDMMTAPEMPRYLLQQNAKFFTERTQMILEAGDGVVDCVGIFNDFGTQQGMLIAPDMYREFVKPIQKEFIQMVHEYGVKVFYHSCGCVSELYPDFIEIGVDIIDPLQFNALKETPAELRQAFPEMNFHGGLDTQNTLPFKRPEEIITETQDLIRTLGDSGHYIFSTSHNIQGGVSFENLQALVRGIKGEDSD